MGTPLMFAGSGGSGGVDLLPRHQALVLAGIARIDCHETASSAPPDQGMSVLLIVHPARERRRSC
jgi:hypothetical protein